MAAILVTDGDQRSALAAVRSLSAVGHSICVCSSRRHSLAGASRYSSREAIVPDALLDPDGFVSAIERLVDRWGIEVLLPLTDASLLALLPAQKRFDGVCMPFPPAERFREISDKRRLMEAAAEIGIRTPAQQIVPDHEHRHDVDVETLSFPLALKPSRSVVETNGHPAKVGVKYAADQTELQQRLEELPPHAYPLLLQQRVAGPGVGIFLLLWKGEMLAVFSHRRIREKPPSGGVSVYRESIDADSDLVAQSRALLERFEWQGAAMVEYKLDTATEAPFLMEVNGRFWGSLQLAVDAGVDFPALLVAAALGRKPRPVCDYRVGIRSRWWWGDIDHLLARLRSSSNRLALPLHDPGRWRAVRDFLALWRPGDRNEVLRLDDPLPFLRETVEWFKEAITSNWRMRP